MHDRPVSSNLFRWAGHADPAAGQEMLDSIRVGVAPLRFTVLEDALLIPGSHAGGAGGILTREGIVLPDGQLRRSGRPLASMTAPPAPMPEPIGTIDREAVWMGRLFNHFGHRLLESLARWWALPEVDPDTLLVFDAAYDGQPSPETREHLHILGFPGDRLLVPAAPVRFRRLIVPEPAVELKRFVHERAADAFRAAGERIAPNLRPTEQPVYFSRRLLGWPARTVVGEAAFEQVLLRNGVLVVYPETMPLAEQIRIACEHRHQIATMGSAAFMSMFNPERPALHLLCSSGQAWNHDQSDYVIAGEAARARTTFVGCLGLGVFADAAFASLAPSFVPQLLDVEAAAGYLAREGLLPNGWNRLALPPAGNLAAEHRERWLLTWFAHLADAGGEWPEVVPREITRLDHRNWPALAAIAANAPAAMLPDRLADALTQEALHGLETEPDPIRRFRHRWPVRDLLEKALTRCQPDTQAAGAAILRERLPW